jgi:hypothetical protein
MNNRVKIIIFSSVFIGLVILYFGLFYSRGKKFDWKESFILDKDKPFGTWLISELLKEYDQERKFVPLENPIYESLNKTRTPSNYVFIGQEIYLEELAIDSLLSYVSRGNNAFIFTLTEPIELLNRLIEEDDSDSLYFLFNVLYSDSAQTMLNEGVEEKEKAYFIPYSNKYSQAYNWNYLEYLPAMDSIQELGTSRVHYEDGGFAQGVNYYSINYRGGKFYFHTQAIIFSNNVLKEGQMLNYSNHVFSYLNHGTIYWEEFNWRFNQPNSKTWLFKPPNFQSGKSPLSFIFSNQALKWSWYLLLIFILIFILFNGKRRMGIIPILPARKNTSLGHIQVISELYKQKNNHYAIAAKVFGNFLSYLQNDLRINTKQNQIKMMGEIAIKTKIDIADIQSIFLQWKSMEKSKEVSTEAFLKFNKEINSFIKLLK